jgi:rhamnosyltransferase
VISQRRFSLCVPIFWPGAYWERFVSACAMQTCRPAFALVVSSGANPADLELAATAGFKCQTIEAAGFDHGGTRQAAVAGIADMTEILVFLTQDAILATPDALEILLKAFDDPCVAAAWGRQLPQDDATPEAAHARGYNYPARPRSVCADDIPELGIKAAFCSNSFAAYRISSLKAIGGFPSQAVLGEDMHAAARLLQAGYRIAYVADATVFHSHNYSPWQEFSRYFDTGAFHAENPWLLEQFGRPLGEGRRFVASQLGYLWENTPSSIPGAMLANVGKYLGYTLGTRFKALPAKWPSRLGMNKTYWKNWYEKQVGSSCG